MNYITSEGFSFHTFELTKEIHREQYRTIKNTLYDSAKFNRNRVYSDHNCLVSEQFKRFGIIIKLYGKDQFNFFQLRINPRIVCGDYNYLGIFLCTEENIAILFSTVNQLLDSIHCGFLMEDMNLTRMDFCVNLQLEDRSITEVYLHCIRKCAIPGKFNRNSFLSAEKDSKTKNKHSFRAAGSELTFTVYDKLFQAEEENLLNSAELYPPALIRFEVSLGQQMIHELAMMGLKSADCTPDLFRYLGYGSRSVMEEVIFIFFPAGRYVTYENAKTEIINARLKRKIRDRMLSLLEHASLCGNLNSAISKLEEEYRLTPYQIRVILQAFEKLRINPVTLTCKDRPYLGIEGVRELLGFETH